MKRSERHRLKENVVAVAVGNLQEQFSERGRTLAIGVAAGLVALMLFGGYSWWSGRTIAQAGALLADALMLADAPVVPPPPPRRQPFRPRPHQTLRLMTRPNNPSHRRRWSL